MVGVGEETGRLGMMLDKVGQLYDKELKKGVKVFSSFFKRPHAGQYRHGQKDGRHPAREQGPVPSGLGGPAHGLTPQSMHGEHVRAHARGLKDGRVHGVGDVHEFEVQKHPEVHVLEPGDHGRQIGRASCRERV